MENRPLNFYHQQTGILVDALYAVNHADHAQAVLETLKA